MLRIVPSGRRNSAAIIQSTGEFTERTVITVLYGNRSDVFNLKVQLGSPDQSTRLKFMNLPVSS